MSIWTVSIGLHWIMGSENCDDVISESTEGQSFFLSHHQEAKRKTRSSPFSPRPHRNINREENQKTKNRTLEHSYKIKNRKSRKTEDDASSPLSLLVKSLKPAAAVIRKTRHGQQRYGRAAAATRPPRENPKGRGAHFGADSSARRHSPEAYKNQGWLRPARRGRNLPIQRRSGNLSSLSSAHASVGFCSLTLRKGNTPEVPPGYDPVVDAKPKTKSAKRNERKKEKKLQVRYCSSSVSESETSMRAIPAYKQPLNSDCVGLCLSRLCWQLYAYPILHDAYILHLFSEQRPLEGGPFTLTPRGRPLYRIPDTPNTLPLLMKDTYASYHLSRGNPLAPRGFLFHAKGKDLDSQAAGESATTEVTSSGLTKGKSLDSQATGEAADTEVLSSGDLGHRSEAVDSVTSQMNKLAVSTSPTVNGPTVDSTESSNPGGPGQDLDKRIRALKKKIRLTETLEKGNKHDINPEQLDKLTKLEGWRLELKLLEDTKAAMPLDSFLIVCFIRPCMWARYTQQAGVRDLRRMQKPPAFSHYHQIKKGFFAMSFYACALVDIEIA
ncbi:hypothetical protein ACLOJK_013856 [Asimina triloba]